MNTQRIVDVLNQHWQADLQQRYNDARLELSQQRQNAEQTKDDRYIDCESRRIVAGNFLAVIESISDALNMRVYARISNGETEI